MLQNKSEQVIKFSKKSVAIVGFIFFLAFSILFLPGQTKLTETYSAGLGSPDTFLFYTPADLYHMAETYGAAGRIAYIKARLTFDIAFPILYTFFLVTSISWFESRVLERGNEFRTANMLPFFAMLFDLLENACTAFVFSSYPTYIPFISMLAPFFTMLKWICVGSSFLFLIIVMVWYLLHWIRGRQK
ncbi:MAG: hypothetical protein AB2L18_10585 [Anaerolineaceae bacterium]